MLGDLIDVQWLIEHPHIGVNWKRVAEQQDVSLRRLRVKLSVLSVRHIIVHHPSKKQVAFEAAWQQWPEHLQLRLPTNLRVPYC